VGHAALSPKSCCRHAGILAAVFFVAVRRRAAGFLRGTRLIPCAGHFPDHFQTEARIVRMCAESLPTPSSNYPGYPTAAHNPPFRQQSPALSDFSPDERTALF
jgi:hypothetical protein